MLEAGLVQLVQSSPSVSTLSPGGGYLRQIPPGSSIPAWTYFTVTNPPNTGLQFVSGSTERRIQIDCYGNEQTDQQVQLAFAIDSVLNGFSGTLPDQDSTNILSCIRDNLEDMETEPDSRLYRRMLEYTLWFVESPPVTP